MTGAVLLAEDARFYQHWGIDLQAIMKSIRSNVAAGRYVHGGSTITQQVVKLAFLSPQKSLFRKAREILGALWLEMILDKKAILSWYLNLAYFGPGVHGIAQAAQSYFETSPELLGVSESIHLTLLLPSPTRRGQRLRSRALGVEDQRRFRVLLDRMRGEEMISHQQWQQALRIGNLGEPLLKDGEG